MPWQETHPMQQRTDFISDHRRGLYHFAELCARYGVSRKTGYKWLARYEAEGPRGLGMLAILTKIDLLTYLGNRT